MRKTGPQPTLTVAIATLLSVVMVAATLTGCGDDGASSDDANMVADQDGSNELIDLAMDLSPDADTDASEEIFDLGGPDTGSDQTMDVRDTTPDTAPDVRMDMAMDASEDMAEVDMTPPAPRDPPPMPTYSGGMCPVLTGGPTKDTSVITGFMSAGDAREFRLLVPPSYDGSSPWPVVFAWHWLNASSGSFVDDGELAAAAEEMGFIVVLPDNLENSNGDSAYQFNWPFVENWGVAKEMTFTMDLLACVNAQFNIDPRRVYGTGVSAGALWLSFIMGTPEVDHFAAMMSMSGGLGEDPSGFGLWRMSYTPRPNKFPAMVLWGGPTDWLGVNFDTASIALRDQLIADDHYVVECIHDAGHAMPPIDTPMDGGTKFRGLWQFLLDHEYGLPPGHSPHHTAGLPVDLPPWCRIASPAP